MQTQATETTNDTQAKHTRNETALRLIDEAVTATKRAAHAVTNPLAKEHLEYALALITESWIAEDGQDAKSTEAVIEAMDYAKNLFEAHGKEGK